MSGGKIRVVHYLNQFFGQEGREEKADMNFVVKAGAVGPGLALEKALEGKGTVVATVVCGDNYFSENLERASEEGIALISGYEPDLFVAGPAFEAGRYGMACGALCKIVRERLNIPAVTGMYEENPGMGLFRKDVFICRTGNSALKMVEALQQMVKLGLKLSGSAEDVQLVSGENIGRPEADGYFPRGILRNEYVEETAAERSVDMVIAKVMGRPFESEISFPSFEKVQIPAPIENLESCEIALVSDGGIVPGGNPDRFAVRGNEVLAAYEIEELFPRQGTHAAFEIAHTGYYGNEVLEDINRLVPVDILRDFEDEGIIGKLHPKFFSTSGNAASSKRCDQMGEEIGLKLKEMGVHAVVLTST